MSDIEDTPDGNITPKKKRRIRNELPKSKHRKQKYRTIWESNSQFKDWIKPVAGDCYRARCLKCQVSFTAELSCLKNHATSKTHLLSVEATPSSSQFIMSKFVATKPNTLDLQTQHAEIKLSGFLAEHNVAFQVIDHLEDLMKNIFPDSNICKQIKLKRTKATNIIKNVIAPSEKDVLVQKLNLSKFSIMVDESTDIGTQSNMCIVVRFYDLDLKQIVSRFWDLVPVYVNEEKVNLGATSENLFNCIINSFEKHGVNFQNIIGFGSDGCSTMMGKNNSVSSRMKLMFPNIVIIKCICHSLHLCCSQACKSLPRCEDLARNIFNFFSHSSKRQSQFKEFQTFCNLKVHKILHPSQTRWLSLFDVVHRILEQWEALRLFFTNKWLSEKLMSAELIFKQLHDPFTKAYFLFLEFILPKFTYLNQYFQTEKVILLSLHEKMEFTYKEILMYYVNRNYVLQTPLGELNPDDKNYILPKKNVYLGTKLSAFLLTNDIANRQDLLLEFQNRCTDFYIVSCLEIKKRYNFSDSIFPMIRMLSPSVATSFDKRDEYPSITSLALQLPRMIDESKLQQIEDQWRTLPLIRLPENIVLDNDPDKFWTYIKQLESAQFNELSLFCLTVMSLPHSNAQCERIFSKMNRLKTNVRNRLITPTVAATLMTSECIKLQGTCVDFMPSKEMLSRMSSSNLYPITSKTDIKTNNTNEPNVTIDEFILRD